MKAADIPRLYKQHGSLKAISRNTGASWRQVMKAYHAAVAAKLIDPLPQGAKRKTELKNPQITIKQRVKALKTKRARHSAYILTCAQNNTQVHPAVWQNLKALAEHYDATIFVSTFLYANRSHWQKNMDKGRATSKVDTRLAKGQRDEDQLWWDPEIVPYINNDRVEIAKGLVWCGELNIIPTAGNPLAGLEVYTGRASMVAPHVKLAMDSIATVGGSGAKLNYTTGTVTQRNYIQRKEGFKAEFHHSYGALLVETDEDGHWWARQLNADSEGTIFDLDLKVEAGEVTTGHRVEAITMGDIHEDEIDPDVKEATWGPGGMVDTLRPKYQFLNDVLSFYRRNHWEIRDPYSMLMRHAQGRESVQGEVERTRDFIKWVKRDDCTTVIVDSNHDRALYQWLRDNDGRKDPVNAVYWSRVNSWLAEYIAMAGEKPSSLLGFVLTMPDPDFEADNRCIFLDNDTSFVICPDHGGGIECSMHGDIGPNGARGNVRSFARMGRRSNVGHSHIARIYEGAYQAGTNSKLRLDYNHGPSAWSHTDIITYQNGKRALVTFYAGKWRA